MELSIDFLGISDLNQCIYGRVQTNLYCGTTATAEVYAAAIAMAIAVGFCSIIINCVVSIEFSPLSSVDLTIKAGFLFCLYMIAY